MTTKSNVSWKPWTLITKTKNASFSRLVAGRCLNTQNSIDTNWIYVMGIYGDYRASSVV
ncbi:AAEL014213-PA [Aedes aegypti]|uniref:AAEL014213-PA n=1 Tax=Aedes aegypti TaxID=7159 RepID=Q16GZ4_AEDAE|nr:AAEL014213-PA [Aedes aegypti]